ncbi:DUF4468 domain-containing protein [Spirosoma areae]
MKHILFAFLLTTTVSVAQTSIEPVYLPIDSTTGNVQFREVISLSPDLDTKAIAQKARTWVAVAYRNAKDVVQQYDPEAGIIIVKGQFANRVFYKGVAQSTSVTVHHMLTIEAKPGRYRVTMNNLEQEAGGMKAFIKANHGSMSEQEYLAEVQKYSSGKGMEKMVMRSAQKNVTTTLTDNRLYTSEFKKNATALLESLKQYMQKKGEKDW